jgi:hypothetical protein
VFKLEFSLLGRSVTMSVDKKLKPASENMSGQQQSKPQVQQGSAEASTAIDSLEALKKTEAYQEKIQAIRDALKEMGRGDDADTMIGIYNEVADRCPNRLLSFRESMQIAQNHIDAIKDLK